jgi:hypothetical protein
MDSRIGKKFALIPILYLFLIGGFIFLHVIQVESFREVVAGFVVRGTILKDRDDRTAGVRKLSVSTQGLTWTFGARTPVMIDTANGIAYSGRLKGYRLIDDGVEILLNMDVSVTFRTDDTGRIAVRPYSSGKDGNVESITLSLFPDEEVQISRAEGVPIVRAEFGESSIFFSIPDEVTLQENEFVFSISGGKGAEVVLETSDGSGLDPYTFWFAQEGALADPGRYEDTLAGFLENAYHGWTNGRFNSNALTWSDGNGSAGFLSGAFNAYMSEAYRRGTLVDVGLTRRIVAKYAPSLTYDTNPHTGDIVRTGRDRYRRDRDVIEEIYGQVRERDPALFLRDDPVGFSLHHESMGLVESIFDLLVSVNPETLEQAVGMLRSCLRGVELFSEMEFCEVGRSIVERHLFSAVVRNGEQMFISRDNDGSCDILLSIQVGKALHEAGLILGQSIYAGVGRQLVISALELADDSGFLPREVVLVEDSVVPSDELVPPEDIYSLFYQGSYVPREIGLTDVLGPGTYIWTAAEELTVTREQEEIVLEFDFPVGYTHHLTVRGIEPFQRAYMFGIRWNTDPYFQNYSSGWAYDADTKTLYVKIRHRAERERMVLSYVRPLPPVNRPADSAGDR